MSCGAADRRAPAPPYEGEGPFALWHLSEDPDLGRLEPRATTDPSVGGPAVWAVDTRHAPLFWFPRDCPRGCVWPSAATSAEDRERFFGPTRATRVHVIESPWLDAVRGCRLYAYELGAETFVPHHVGGYWVSPVAVEARGRTEVGDLLARHAAAGFELRVTPSLLAFWRVVVPSSLEFSGCRLANAMPDPGPQR